MPKQRSFSFTNAADSYPYAPNYQIGLNFLAEKAFNLPCVRQPALVIQPSSVGGHFLYGFLRDSLSPSTRVLLTYSQVLYMDLLAYGFGIQGDVIHRKPHSPVIYASPLHAA